MIRPYNEKDTEQVIDIWYTAQSLAHPFLSEDFLKMVQDMMLNKFLPNSKTWIFEEEGTILGFISMMGNEIGGLFVHPSKHSKGIGTQLVNFVQPMFDTLEVEVFSKNKIGRGFYNKYGFHLMKEYLHEVTNEKVLRLVK